MRQVIRLVARLFCAAALLSLGCEELVERPYGGEVTISDPDLTWDGYLLYSGTENAGAYLIDMEADVVHVWEDDPSIPNWGHIELQPDLTLVAVTGGFDAHEGSVMYVDWEMNVLQHLYHPCHHDAHRLPSGNTVILGREYVVNHEIFDDELKSEYFAEITPDGDVLWEWHTDEHASKLEQFVEVNYVDDPDWAHANSVEIMPANASGDADSRFREGNLLFSYCALNIIGVIDMDTMALVWAWGPGELQGQHAPTMLENGHILIFDNGSTREWTRVVELDPITGEIVWTYQASPKRDFYSRIYGGAQRLPNGNTLITESLTARVFEVTPDGEIVWEWWGWEVFEEERMPFYRAYRYDPALFDGLL